MAYRGYVRNGIVVLHDAITLPDGALVEVDLIAEDAEAALCDRLKSVIGAAKGLPPDAAQNVDHYLFGQPKR
jgi:hypothetical protein